MSWKLPAAAAALSLAGCSSLLGFDDPVAVTACGPLHEVAPLAFDGLSSVTDLSADASGTRGFVMAARAGTTLVRLVPVAFDGAAWRADDAREGNLATLVTTAGLGRGRANGTGQLVAALAEPPGVYELALAGDTWTFDADAPIVAGADAVPGSGTTRDGIQIIPIVTGTAVTLYSGATQLAGATDAINAAHDVSQAALAVAPTGELVLAFAAGGALHLARERPGGTFTAGEPIAALDGTGDELEPWLSPDCTAVTYRRGAVILAASGVP
jgi:hypothetical protein